MCLSALFINVPIPLLSLSQINVTQNITLQPLQGFIGGKRLPCICLVKLANIVPICLHS